MLAGSALENPSVAVAAAQQWTRGCAWAVAFLLETFQLHRWLQKGRAVRLKLLEQ